MIIYDNSRRAKEDLDRDIFLLTKPPHSDRARLCFRRIERSKNATLYLVGDRVYNLLSRSIEALPQNSICVCKEDMEARGVQSVDTEISFVDFYEQLVEDMMATSDRVYAF